MKKWIVPVLTIVFIAGFWVVRTLHTDGIEGLPGLAAWGAGIAAAIVLIVATYSFVVNRAARRALADLADRCPGALLLVVAKTRGLSRWTRSRGIPVIWDPLVISASVDEGVTLWAAEYGLPRMLLSIPATEVVGVAAAMTVAEDNYSEIGVLRLSTRDDSLDLTAIRDGRFWRTPKSSTEVQSLAMQLSEALASHQSGAGMNEVRITPLTNDFWGPQGRVGRITRGEDAGRHVFVYPDTWPESWCVITQGAKLERLFVGGNNALVATIERWGVEWLPTGPEEDRIERDVFGQRPLVESHLEWLA